MAAHPPADHDVAEPDLSQAVSYRQLVAELNKWLPWAAMGPQPRPITARRIKRWYEFRSATGFPEAIGRRIEGSYPAVLVWDMGQVLEWFLVFTPAKGGPPTGNSNGLRHGRYRGLHKRRAARNAKTSGEG